MGAIQRFFSVVTLHALLSVCVHSLREQKMKRYRGNIALSGCQLLSSSVGHAPKVSPHRPLKIGFPVALQVSFAQFLQLGKQDL